MPVPQEIDDQFVSGIRTDRVRFALNDSVRVLSGPHKDRVAAAISVVAIEPEPIYLVEPGSPPYGDLEIQQSCLELLL